MLQFTIECKYSVLLSRLYICHVCLGRKLSLYKCYRKEILDDAIPMYLIPVAWDVRCLLNKGATISRHLKLLTDIQWFSRFKNGVAELLYYSVNRIDYLIYKYSITVRLELTLSQASSISYVFGSALYQCMCHLSMYKLTAAFWQFIHY